MYGPCIGAEAFEAHPKTVTLRFAVDSDMTWDALRVAELLQQNEVGKTETGMGCGAKLLRKHKTEPQCSTTNDHNSKIPWKAEHLILTGT